MMCIYAYVCRKYHKLTLNIIEKTKSLCFMPQPVNGLVNHFIRIENEIINTVLVYKYVSIQLNSRLPFNY